MGLQLLPAECSDIREIVEVLYAANSDPHDPFVDLCLPGLGNWSNATREEGIEDVAKSYLEEWQASKTQTWYKVIDKDSGKIISASRWEIYHENPYAGGTGWQETPWLPAGSRLREYAEWLVNERIDWAVRRCQCAHVWLDICVTTPEFRRRGAASLALQWGIEKADEMNVRAFIEASVNGAQLYEKFGFVTTDVVDLKKEDKNGDTEWEELALEYPLRFRWMERDIKGK